MVDEEPRVRVVVLTALYPPAFRGGGPLRTIAALVASAPPRSEVYVVTSNRDLGQSDLLDVTSDAWQTQGAAQVYFASVSRVVGYVRVMRQIRSRRPEVIYLNSFFDARFSIIPQALAKLGFFGSATIALAPRGEFGTGALSLKSRKKRAFIAAYKATGMYRGTVWQASSEREARDLRAALPRAGRVLVHEDDVALPAQASPIPQTDPGRLRAVNIGRLVPIKGVAPLLQALALVDQPLVLDIYGPDEDPTYAAWCRELAGLVSPRVEVHFRGEIPHGQVRSTLSQYDLMLFPTEGENFGHVVAEALSVGCPVMCGDTTPWTERLRHGGGVIVEPRGIAEWATAVDLYAAQDPAQIRARRQDAAAAYERWRAASEHRPHLFELFQDELSGGLQRRPRPESRG